MTQLLIPKIKPLLHPFQSEDLMIQSIKDAAHALEYGGNFVKELGTLLQLCTELNNPIHKAFIDRLYIGYSNLLGHSPMIQKVGYTSLGIMYEGVEGWEAIESRNICIWKQYHTIDNPLYAQLVETFNRGDIINRNILVNLFHDFFALAIKHLKTEKELFDL